MDSIQLPSHISNILRGLCIAILFQAVPVPSLASADDAAQRVNVAGNQRKFSQRIAKSLCYAGLLEYETFTKNARAAILEFDNGLHALQHGGLLGIHGPEQNPEVLELMDPVIRLWRRLGPDYWTYAAGGYDSTFVFELVDDNLLLLEHSNRLVEQIAVTYTGFGGDQGILNTINFAGSLRTLMEKAVKDACFVSRNFRDLDARASLSGDIDLINNRLSMLEVGNRGEQILAPPHAFIGRQLMDVRQLWVRMEPVLMSVLQDQAVREQTYRDLYRMGNDFVLQANHLTELYISHFAGAARRR